MCELSPHSFDLTIEPQIDFRHFLGFKKPPSGHPRLWVKVKVKVKTVQKSSKKKVQKFKVHHHALLSLVNFELNGW